jgi:riboflavin synthase
MFTGLVENVGRIERLTFEADGGGRLCVATALGGELRPGDSIAVSGICLTATAADATGFDADVSPQTRRVTSAGTWLAGRPVNLERAVRADARLGGHFVLGHVDGVASVYGLRPDGDGHWLEVDVPEALLAGLVPKGSVAVDGVSLTVAALEGARVGIQVVPFTLEHTAIARARAGDAVNIETDVIGKYVARLMGFAGPAPEREET